MDTGWRNLHALVGACSYPPFSLQKIFASDYTIARMAIGKVSKIYGCNLHIIGCEETAIFEGL